MCEDSDDIFDWKKLKYLSGEMDGAFCESCGAAFLFAPTSDLLTLIIFGLVQYSLVILDWGGGEQCLCFFFKLKLYIFVMSREVSIRDISFIKAVTKAVLTAQKR